MKQVEDTRHTQQDKENTLKNLLLQEVVPMWTDKDFPVWERVKHIVPVYNAHPSYKLKNLGIILSIIQP
jgi:hypothetical protein